MAQEFRSDTIPDLRKFLEAFPGMLHDCSTLRMPLILDANVVIKAILWMLKTRKNPTATPEVLEVLEAGTVAAYAPSFLAEEVRKTLPKLADEKGLNFEEAEAIWLRFEARITFIDVGGAGPADCRDPKDVPYLRLQERLQVGIVTHDDDISGMGGRVTKPRLIAVLRAYSREAATELHLTAAGVISVSVPTLLTMGTLKFLGSHASKLMTKAPGLIWITLLIFGAALLLFPAFRQWLAEKGASLLEALKAATTSVMDFVAPFIEQHAAAKQQLESYLKEIALLEPGVVTI